MSAVEAATDIGSTNDGNNQQVTSMNTETTDPGFHHNDFQIAEPEAKWYKSIESTPFQVPLKLKVCRLRL